MIELEAPVRSAIRRCRGTGSLALVDGRKTAPEKHLAAKLELFGCLEAGIDPPSILQSLELAIIKVEPFRLPHHFLGLPANTVEIIANGLIELGRRTLSVGIVDPKDEAPAMFARKQVVVQSGSYIADVKSSGRERARSA